MPVFNLGTARDLLADWDEVRQCIVRGKVQAWAVSMRDDLGRESIYLGGVYKSDSEAATKASMRVSWEQTKASDLEEEVEEPATGTKG